MAVAAAPVSPAEDKPRAIVAPVSFGDRVFRGVLSGSGVLVLAVTAGILVFLAQKSIPAFQAEGLRFFTTTGQWLVTSGQFGIAAILPMSVLIAVIALVIAAPVGLATALFISEYAPPRLRKLLIATIDLMAAIPSIVVAIFGFYFVMPRMLGFDAWLSQHASFLPFFSFTLPVSSINYTNSMFIAGVLVSVLVIPIITSLSRQVFSQAPQGEREAAYALGSTRWGMIRTVVLPYGRAGMIGSSMLGLGRALGETMVVSFILTASFTFDYHILETHGNSITYMIALRAIGATGLELSALLASGMCLFVMTMAVNTVAAIIVTRSRSGATASAD